MTDLIIITLILALIGALCWVLYLDSQNEGLKRQNKDLRGYIDRRGWK